MFISTLDSIPDRKFHVLGLVMGSQPYLADKYESGIKNLRGTTQPDIATKFEEGRRAALRRMAANCPKGTDAVLGVRFHVRVFGNTWMDLCAYGTAVRYLDE